MNNLMSESLLPSIAEPVGLLRYRFYSLGVAGQVSEE
jgi:hypothetical protein